MTPPPLDRVAVPHWAWRTLLLAWSAPVLFAFIWTAGTAASLGGQPPLWRLLVIGGACWYAWVPLTPLVARLTDRVPVERPVGVGALAVHALGALVACLVQALATVITTMLLIRPSAGFGEMLVGWWLAFLPAGVVVYAAVVGVRTVQVTRARLAEGARQARELSARLAEAQLAALRSQLQPHFLFNALNAVIALVRDHESARAAEALTQLAALLRAALRSGAEQEVTLAEEAEFTAHYLDLERMRFGDRLQVRIEVPAELETARVPSFLLQPLVENALKHGLRHVRRTGNVWVTARERHGALEVSVEDDGAGLAVDWEERGMQGCGIANARARLQQLYGGSASLRLTARAHGEGTRVVAQLPYRVSARVEAGASGATAA